MTNWAPKDYFGNELYVGDTVVFSPIPSTDLIEGTVEKIEGTKDEQYLEIETKKPYNNIVIWQRDFNRVIKKFKSKQKQESTKNNSLLLCVYTACDKFVEYRNADCEVKEFENKLFLYVYNNSDNSLLALWNMDSIYGYSFEEDWH